MRSIQAIFSFCLSRYFNDDILFSSHSRKTHFKTGCHIIFHSHTFLCQFSYHPHWSPFSDLSLSYINGCCSINKHFTFDSFLAIEDHHCFFDTYSHARTTYTSDFSTTLAIFLNKKCSLLKEKMQLHL